MLAAPGARRARTGCTPSGTRTSTRPGCGRCARPSARWPARSPTSLALHGAATTTLVFAASSAQQYAWMQEHHPELFARIRRRRSRPGRFVPVGGMWVESDTNMPGGEALARQFVHGKRFFLRASSASSRARCGCPTRSATPPRCRRSSRRPGARWFLTQKISWNETNLLPHHTFWWEGIDGTRIFTHFPPVDTYNAELSGAELARAAAPVRREGPGQHVAGAVRLGRRRRRADPGDAGRGAPAPATWRARRRCAIEHARGVLRRRRGGVPAAAGVVRASCTWSSTAAPTPRRRAPSAATGAASTCCARPSCGRPRPRCATGAAYPYEALRRLLEDRAAAPVPRHPARHLDRLGAPGGRARVRPGRGRAGGRRSRDALARARPGRATASWPATPGPYAGGRGARRWASRPPGRRHRRPTGRRTTDDGVVLDNGASGSWSTSAA